jgi:ATP-dependent Clp protease adapter protein ClpS
MKFVVDALVKYLYLDRSNATQAMLAIHKNGRAVMAVHSHDEAARISRLISVEAERSGYPLICRVAQAQPTSSPGEGS